MSRLCSAMGWFMLGVGASNILQPLPGTQWIFMGFGFILVIIAVVLRAYVEDTDE